MMLPLTASEARVVAEHIAQGIRGRSRFPGEAATTRCVVLNTLDFAMLEASDDDFHRFLLTRVKSVLEAIGGDDTAFVSPGGYNVMDLTPCIWLLSAVIAYAARAQRMPSATFASVVRRGAVAFVHRPTAYYGMVDRRSPRAHLVHESDDGGRVWHVGVPCAAGKPPNPEEWQTFDRSGLAQLGAAASLVLNFSGHLAALSEPACSALVADWSPVLNDVSLRHTVPPSADMPNKQAICWVTAGALALVGEYDKLLGGHEDTAWVAARTLTAPHGAGHYTLSSALGKCFPQRSALVLRVIKRSVDEANGVGLCMTERPPANSRIGLRDTFANSERQRQRSASKMPIRRKVVCESNTGDEAHASADECRALAHTVFGLTELPSAVCMRLLGMEPDAEPDAAITLAHLSDTIDALLLSQDRRVRARCAAHEYYGLAVDDVMSGQPVLPHTVRMMSTIRYALLRKSVGTTATAKPQPKSFDACAFERGGAPPWKRDGGLETPAAGRHGDDADGAMRHCGGGCADMVLDDGFSSVVCI